MRAGADAAQNAGKQPGQRVPREQPALPFLAGGAASSGAIARQEKNAISHARPPRAQR